MGVGWSKNLSKRHLCTFLNVILKCFLISFLANQTYGQYRQAQQSAAQSAGQPAGQNNQLLGLLQAAARPAQPGSYPGYPTSSQVNFK